MNVKEYILQGNVNLTELAKFLYPNNKNAISYLSRKLHGKDNRTFTKKDAEKAIEFIKEKCRKVDSLTLE